MNSNNNKKQNMNMMMGGMMNNKNNKDHPYGTTLLARNNEQNRKKWGNNAKLGYIPVEKSICHIDSKTGEEKCPYYDYIYDATYPNILQTKIHLLIASFRDRLCPRTIHNAFSKAENSHRIFIRIIEQTSQNSNLLDDASCWERYCSEYNKNCEEEYKNNVHVIWRDSSKSKGPTDARSKLSAMIQWDYVHRNIPNELDFEPVNLNDFCMQTDSHMDFSTHYDTELILMFHRTTNDYAVLSTYVADISQNNQNITTVPNLCMVTFTSTIRNWGTKECVDLARPKLTNAMWGAGLSFHRCHAEINVPVDPYLDGVFDGEEGSRGIRFFTHGYDVYTPDKVVVTHDYKNHQGNPVVHTWGRGSSGKSKQEEQLHKWRIDIENARKNLIGINGVGRINMMLGIGHGNDDPNYPDGKKPSKADEISMIRKSRYGLGTKRNLDDVKNFTGIDLRERTMYKNGCGNLYWVPYNNYDINANNYYGVHDILTKRSLSGDNNRLLEEIGSRSFTNIKEKIKQIEEKEGMFHDNNSHNNEEVHGSIDNRHDASAAIADNNDNNNNNNIHNNVRRQVASNGNGRNSGIISSNTGSRSSGGSGKDMILSTTTYVIIGSVIFVIVLLLTTTVLSSNNKKRKKRTKHTN